MYGIGCLVYEIWTTSHTASFLTLFRIYPIALPLPDARMSDRGEAAIPLTYEYKSHRHILYIYWVSYCGQIDACNTPESI